MTQSKRLSAVEVFDAYLRSNGKRRTAERFAILGKITAMNTHFSAEELSAVINADGYHVSPTTVYSTLELLVECGLVVKHRFANKAMLYERSAGMSQCHHHLICTVCGKIKELRDNELSQLISSKRLPAFEQQYFTLTIYGICGACSRKRRRAKLNT